MGKGGKEAGYEGESVNGEEVERRARELQWVEFVRAGIAGCGFVMSVVGIWGEGA
jgi:autophagy-related protein 33